MTGTDKLKQTWNENPLLVLAIIGGAAKGLAALINARSAAKSRKAYARQVNYRIVNRGGGKHSQN